MSTIVRMAQGSPEWHEHRLRLTRRARLLGNEVFGRFLEDAETQGLLSV